MDYSVSNSPLALANTARFSSLSVGYLLELYATIERIVHEELPLLYLHHLTALQAGALSLQGYAPAISGPFSIRGGGIHTASSG